jgi:hypothetical protein
MLDAEASLRTLHAYVDIVQGRLALARATGNRRELAGVSDADLANAAALCASASDGLHAVLDRIDPHFSSMAAAIADLSCQRELALPRPATPRRLRLVSVEEAGRA